MASTSPICGSGVGGPVIFFFSSSTTGAGASVALAVRALESTPSASLLAAVGDALSYASAPAPPAADWAVYAGLSKL